MSLKIETERKREILNGTSSVSAFASTSLQKAQEAQRERKAKELIIGLK